ncbi:hypothetical protein PO909_033606, partial [Leuciscus waleckii]
KRHVAINNLFASPLWSYQIAWLHLSFPLTFQCCQGCIVTPGTAAASCILNLQLGLENWSICAGCDVWGIVGRRHTLLGLEMYTGASRHERRPMRLHVLHNACIKSFI